MSAAFDVDRILSLSNEQLANLRAPVDECSCDRGCSRPATTLVEVRPLVLRFVCDRCAEDIECACGCGEVLPRWMTTTVDGEVFGPKCCGTEPGAAW